MKRLSIATLTVALTTAAAVLSAKHHVILLDCSGSMSRDLSGIRNQLRDKLPGMIGEDDLVTIIWFSGKGQAGYVTRAMPVRRLADYAELTKALDSQLYARGLTGFVDPINLAASTIEAVGGHYATNLFFMSDGCDNEWKRGQIMDACLKLAPSLGAATVVEYGYYADRPTLTRMAEVLGGSLIFSDTFTTYQPTFEKAIRQEVGSRRVEVKLPQTPADGLVFALHDGNVLTFDGTSGVVSVPEGVRTLHYAVVGSGSKTDADALYAALALYAQRMQPEVVYDLLQQTGDVRLIKMFANCFGKQAYSAFIEEAILAAFDDRLKLVEGYDPSLVPDENATTLLDVLALLAGDDNNRFLPDHEAFVYNPIGRRTVQAEGLTDKEQDDLTAKFKKALESGDPAESRKVQAEMEKVFSRSEFKPRFKAARSDRGYPISALVPNASRPNISALIYKPGTVTFEMAPEGMPLAVESGVYRNYTLIKDGLVNVDVLPVLLTEETYRELNRLGVPTQTRVMSNAELADYGWSPYFVYELNLKSLPVINRAMMTRVSAGALAQLEFMALQLKADAKVYEHFLTQMSTVQAQPGLSAKYGDDAARWLAEQGVTDRGFAPKVEKVPATDHYMSKELKVSLKGYSSIPKVEDVLGRIRDEKALTPAQQLLAPAISHAQDILRKYPTDDLRMNALRERSQANRKMAKDIGFQTARIKFSVIVGQTWFAEFATLDDRTITVDVDGTPVTATFDLTEKRVEI